MVSQSQSVIPARSKRTYKPKVRSGCITCKIRRVKCDEAKPACLRCTSTGRKCDGYAPLNVIMFEICEDVQERRSFHYFRERTVSEICSFNTSRFWSRLVLQAGYARETVRHALVAIGSFHESLENKQSTQRVLQSRFTLEQNNKAIKALTTDAKLLSIEEVLISCIVFIFFENVQGHFDTALKHLENGLKILSEWRAKRLHGAGTPSAVIEDELAGILDTLHIQASVLLPESDSDAKKIYTNTLPDSFANIQEAHHYFYQLIHWTCENLESLPASDGASTCGGPSKFVRDSFIPPRCATVLFQWRSMLERDINHDIGNTAMTPQQRIATRLGVIHLKIQYRIVIIMLRCLPFKTEMVFDQQIKHFRDIVDLVQEFLELCATPELNLSEATQLAGFDFFVIPSLSMVACRCRDPTIRRKAIVLLRSAHWREDIWDSFDASSVAEHVMLTEEQGRAIESCVEVPDFDRLHLVGCTSFAYSEQLQGLELRLHHTFDPEWVKMTCVRSGRDSFQGGIEEIWLNRHGDSSLASRPGFFPQEVDGLFPQVVRAGSQLFSMLNTDHAVRFMGRFHANNVFSPQRTRGTGRHGDYVTLSGEFTEYLATDRHTYELP